MHKFVESVTGVVRHSNISEEHKMITVSAMLGKKMSDLLAEMVMVRGLIEHSTLEREIREKCLEMLDEFIYENRQHEEKLIHMQKIICDEVGDYHKERDKY